MEDRTMVVPSFQIELPAAFADSLRRSGIITDVTQSGKDACKAETHGLYFAVFDGHDSAKAADIASRRMHTLLAKQLDEVAAGGCVHSSFS